MAHLSDPKPATPLHAEHIHVTRKKSIWLWLLVPLAILGLVALFFLGNRAAPTANASLQGDAIVGNAIVGDTRVVTYKKRLWEVKGDAATFPAGEVLLVGRSDEGDALYVHQDKGYLEAKGSESVDNTISTPSGRVYLKNSDGRYQPLFQKPLTKGTH